MSAELDRVLERVRQNKTAQAETARDVVASGPFVSRLAGGQYLAGDRVFDTVSGREGRVEATTAQKDPPFTLVTVRLDVGGLVLRPPAQLVLRPLPPQPSNGATR